jgi:hypothetical protein
MPRAGTRTQDLLIKSQLVFRVSHRGYSLSARGTTSKMAIGTSPIEIPRKYDVGLQLRAKALLFDHLVGASEQRIWHGNTKFLGGLEVDGEPVLGRLLERQVRNLGAF